MTTWRTRLTLMGIMVLLIALLPLFLNSQRASASSLDQISDSIVFCSLSGQVGRTQSFRSAVTDDCLQKALFLPPNGDLLTPTPEFVRISQVLTPTNTATNAPTPTNTPIPSVTPTNAPISSVTPTGSPSSPIMTPVPKKGGGGGAPPGPSGTPAVSGCVKSIGKDGVSLSTEPGFYKPHVQIAPVGDILFVVQGPVRADNIQWWLLRTANGIEGWGSQDNITPNPGPCVPVKATSALVNKALPQTGSGAEGWFFLAFALAAVVIVVGIARRGLQAQVVAPGSDQGNDEKDLKE